MGEKINGRCVIIKSYDRSSIIDHVKLISKANATFSIPALESTCKPTLSQDSAESSGAHCLIIDNISSLLTITLVTKKLLNNIIDFRKIRLNTIIIDQNLRNLRYQRCHSCGSPNSCLRLINNDNGIFWILDR